MVSLVCEEIFTTYDCRISRTCLTGASFDLLWDDIDTIDSTRNLLFIIFFQQFFGNRSNKIEFSLCLNWFIFLNHRSFLEQHFVRCSFSIELQHFSFHWTAEFPVVPPFQSKLQRQQKFYREKRILHIRHCPQLLCLQKSPFPRPS